MSENKPEKLPRDGASFLERHVRRFEKEVGELHSFNKLGKDEYVKAWRHTLNMRLAQEEITEFELVVFDALLDEIDF